MIRLLRKALSPRRLARRDLERLCRGRVVSGPFRGLSYVERSVGSSYFPKLLGTYEKEIWPFLRDLIRTAPNLVVNLGSAEGYYCVGLARVMPTCRIIASDPDPVARQLTTKLALRNEVVDQIDVRPALNASDLEDLLGSHPASAIVCDIEGHEEEVLDPALVPSLKRAALLVELHGIADPTLPDRVLRRFATSHDLSLAQAQPRTIRDWPHPTLASKLLPSRHFLELMDEGRSESSRYAWLTPHPLGAKRLRTQSSHPEGRK